MEAGTKAQVTMDIVHVEGRTIEGIKVMGLLPEHLYGTADFNIYVRWDLEYGAVRATRSDTDESIVVVGLTGRKAKGAAFAELMQALADHYGLTVVVQADPGIKGAHALKLCGTWASNLIEISTEGTECLCDDIFAQRQAGKVPPIGGLYCPGDGLVFVRQGADASDDVITASGIVIERNQAPQADACTIERECWVCLSGSVCFERCTVCGGTNAQPCPTHDLDASDIAEANAQEWAEAGSPRDEAGQPTIPTKVITDRDMREYVTATITNAGEPIEDFDVNAIVVELQQRFGTVNLDAVDAEVYWQTLLAYAVEREPKAPSLPIRTPGSALASLVSVVMSEQTWASLGLESEIWAGTDLIEPMRRTRLSRRGKKSLEKAFREGCCGRADHERWCRTWRPITKRHARRMGIDRKDAALLRPRFADLLAARVGK